MANTEYFYSKTDAMYYDAMEDGIKTMAQYFRDAEQGIYPPIYYGTRSEAWGKRDEWLAMRISHAMDTECITDIRHFLYARLNRPTTQEETDRMIQKWGIDRISYDLACTVRYGYKKEAFTKENVLWAYSIPMPRDDAWNNENVIDSMPENLDRFITQVREHIRLKALAEEQAKVAAEKEAAEAAEQQEAEDTATPMTVAEELVQAPEEQTEAATAEQTTASAEKNTETATETPAETAEQQAAEDTANPMPVAEDAHESQAAQGEASITTPAAEAEELTQAADTTAESAMAEQITASAEKNTEPATQTPAEAAAQQTAEDTANPTPMAEDAQEPQTAQGETSRTTPAAEAEELTQAPDGKTETATQAADKTAETGTAEQTAAPAAEGTETATEAAEDIQQVPVPKRKKRNPADPSKPRKPRTYRTKRKESQPAAEQADTSAEAAKAQEEEGTAPSAENNKGPSKPASEAETDAPDNAAAALNEAAENTPPEHAQSAAQGGTNEEDAVKENEEMAVKAAGTKTRTAPGKGADTRTMEDLEREAAELERMWAAGSIEQENEPAEDVKEAKHEGMAEVSKEEEYEPEAMAGGSGKIPRNPKITMQNPENDGLHSTQDVPEGDYLPPERDYGVIHDTAEGAAADGKTVVVGPQKDMEPVTEQTAEKVPDVPVAEDKPKRGPGRTKIEKVESKVPRRGSGRPGKTAANAAEDQAAQTAAEPAAATQTKPVVPVKEPAHKDPVVVAEAAEKEPMAESPADAGKAAEAAAESGSARTRITEETEEEDPFVKGSEAPPAAPAPAPVEPGRESPKPAPERPAKTVWFRAIVSSGARIRMYDRSSFMRMPLSGKYAGYTYNFANRFIDPNPIKVSKATGSGSEEALVLAFPESFTFTLTSREEGKEDVTLNAREFYEAVNGTKGGDYAVQRKARGERNWYTVRIPAVSYNSAVQDEQSDIYNFTMPDRGKGDTFIVPKFLAERQENGDYVVHIADDREIRLWNRNKSAGYISAENLRDVILASAPEDYTAGGPDVQRQDTEDAAAEKDEMYVFVPAEAKICDTASSSLFRMPDGQYENYSFYFPANRMREVNGGYDLQISKNMPVRVFGKGTTEKMPAELFADQFAGHPTYTNKIERPSGILRGRILSHERQLRENVPEEMKAKPNWVVMRTRLNERTGHLDKFLINPWTGKFAESDNPSTWADFETAMQYAKEHGGETVAYALDGKDGICCLDVDNCLDEKGGFTPVAQRARNAVPAGCYAETSVSGKGIHFFGRMEPTEVRSFSKDGKMEFYRKAHFISMTGACREGETKLESLDTPDMRYFIRNNFAKRAEYKKTGGGMDGLSHMSDRDILEKAFSARGGDTTRQLFQGNDLRHNHSNSDMALMNRLAFWCNGDREQMMRIFSASGLYRPEKSQDYYECTIIKALADTPDRYDPESFRRQAEERRQQQERQGGKAPDVSYGASSAPSSKSSPSSSEGPEAVKANVPVYGRYGNVKGYTGPDRQQTE